MEAAADIPLSDNSAVRVVLGGESADGHIKNTQLNRDDTTGWDSHFGRIKWLLEDESNGEWRLSLNHAKFDSGNDFFASQEQAKKHEPSATSEGQNNTEFTQLSGQYTGTLDNGNQLLVTLGTNKTRWEYELPSSVFGGLFSYDTTAEGTSALETKQLSSEIRLPGERGKLDWLSGIYLGRFERKSPALNDFSACCRFFTETFAEITGHTQAVFGELGLNIDEHWRLAGALRYEQSKRKMDWRLRVGADNTTTTLTTINDLRLKDQEWLPEVTLSFTPNEQQKAWFKLARGYKGAVGAARVNIARFVGFALGMLAGGNGMLLLVPELGWGAFSLSCGAVMLAIGLMSLGFSELASAPQTGSDSASAPAVSLKSFFAQPLAWRILSIAFLFKLSHAFSDGMIKSFWVDQGLSLSDISLYSTLNFLVLGVLGAPLAAWLIMRKNSVTTPSNHTGTTDSDDTVSTTVRVAIGFGLCSALGLGLFASLILLDQKAVTELNFNTFYIVIPMLLGIADGASSLAFLTLFMRWSVGHQLGTSFTLFLCAESLGATAFAMLAGTVAAYLGYTGHFIMVAFITVLAMFYTHKTISLYTQTLEENAHD